MSSRWRRVGASVLLIAQIYIFSSFLKTNFHPIRFVIHSLSWIIQMRVWMLATALGHTQVFVTSYGYTAYLSFIANIALIVVALFVNAAWLVFALTLVLPPTLLAVSYLSSSCIATKDLLKTLISAHSRKPERQQDASPASLPAPAAQDASPVSLPAPAAKTYVFERGWNIEKLVIENLNESFRLSRFWWFDVGERVSDWGWGHTWFVFYWVLVIRASCYLSSLLLYALAIEFCSLFTTLYTLLLLAWMSVVTLCIVFFSIINMLYMRAYHIYLRCPVCYKDMQIPIYLCPTCQMEHAQLRPGTYGVLWQRCSKCTTKLPTLDILGRKKLTSMCPHCHHILNSDIGQGTDIHIAIVGAADAGKTTYLVTALHEFVTMYPRQYTTTITFTDVQQQERVQMLFQQMQSGEVPRSTREVVPQAYTLKVQEQSAHVPHIVYLYDAGEQAFASAVNSSQQEYYRYVHGIIFMIDPLTLSSAPPLPVIEGDSSQSDEPKARSASFVSDSLRDDDGIALTSRPGYLEIMQVYERMLQILESSSGLKHKRQYVQPMAIVMTKIDACSFNAESAELGRLLSGNTAAPTEMAVTQQQVRTFLATHGLDPFIRDVESHFASVEYFACSAAVSLQASQDLRPMPPLHVLQPLVWILKHTKSLK